MENTTQNKPTRELIQYVRNLEGQRIGVVLAINADKIGWSKCCKRDKWDRKWGLEIARRRAHQGFKAQIPFAIEEPFRRMVERAEKYFKKTPEESRPAMPSNM